SLFATRYSLLVWAAAPRLQSTIVALTFAERSGAMLPPIALGASIAPTRIQPAKKSARDRANLEGRTRWHCRRNIGVSVRLTTQWSSIDHGRSRRGPTSGGTGNLERDSGRRRLRRPLGRI